MKRYFDLNTNTDNNFCDVIESYMVEIPDNGKPYGLVNGEVTDISQTPRYIAEQKAKEKAIQKAEILKQIDELEQSQARAIREIALNKDTTFAMGKLQLLDEQITELRGQLNA